MPYRSIWDLPDSQVAKYSRHLREAFLKAFNRAFEQYGGDERIAFAVAHTAAKHAREEGSGED
jgi:cation transport regulator